MYAYGGRLRKRTWKPGLTGPCDLPSSARPLRSRMYCSSLNYFHPKDGYENFTQPWH